MANELKGKKKSVQKAGGGKGDKRPYAKVSSCEGRKGNEPAGNDDTFEIVHEQFPGGSGEGGKTTPANNKTGGGGAGNDDEEDGGGETGRLTS